MGYRPLLARSRDAHTTYRQFTLTITPIFRFLRVLFRGRRFQRRENRLDDSAGVRTAGGRRGDPLPRSSRWQSTTASRHAWTSNRGEPGCPSAPDRRMGHPLALHGGAAGQQISTTPSGPPIIVGAIEATPGPAGQFQQAVAPIAAVADPDVTRPLAPQRGYRSCRLSPISHRSASRTRPEADRPDGDRSGRARARSAPSGCSPGIARSDPGTRPTR